MFLAELQFLADRGDAPLGAFEVEFGPLHAAQLARAHEQHWCERKRGAGAVSTFVPVDVAEQPAQHPGVLDGREMVADGCGQRADQVSGWVALSTCCCDGISKDLAHVLTYPARGIQRAAVLNRPQALEQDGGGDLGDRHVAEPGQHIVVETNTDLAAVGFGPLDRLRFEPLVGDRAEGVVDLVDRSELLDALLDPGVDILEQLTFRRLPSVTRLGERDGGVGPKRKQLFLAGEGVLQPPQLAT